MAVDANIGILSPDTIRKDTWEPIGDLAAQLKRKVEIQLGEGNSEAAEAYHALLVELEASK